jgi:hypothetical protein
MPSPQSIARNAKDLTRGRSRVAIGAGAASVATLGSLISLAAATPGPPASLTAYHGSALASTAAVSPAIHTAGAAAGHQPATAAPESSPQVASAPSQQQAPGTSLAGAASPQVASAPSQQQAPAGSLARTAGPGPVAPSGQQESPAASDLLAASPQVAAAPAEAQAATAASSAPQSAAPAHSVVASAQPVGAPTPVQSTAAAQPAATAAPAAAPQPAPQPYWIYDSVTPSSLPSSSQAVAVYANGNYAASPAQVGRRGLVLWIDTNGSDIHADVLDVEPGDATPSQAATWVAQKLDASPNSVAIVYTMRSDWGAVQAAINALPWWMPSHTRYWIADPTGVPHIVPGSQATQWYWGQNFDISTALPNF